MSVGIHIFSLRFVGWDDAVAKHVGGDAFDIFRKDVVATIEEGEAAGTTGELKAGTGGGSGSDELVHRT